VKRGCSCGFLPTLPSLFTLPHVKLLQSPDSIHLKAAHGWLDLNNHEEAFVKGQLASAEAKDVKFEIDSNARDI